ncbi:Crp/Fnr family transcriptional regulator [Thermohalobacter berrensis]|nr:Crp/Fnr family transcriptional regulator [Thermohalobacter berrensis]
MYDELFNRKRQEKMRSFFLDSLSKKGMVKDYGKDEIIDIPDNHCVGIVTKGKIKQSLYSSKGTEKTLYILLPGEIFGEMTYFCGGQSNMITRAMEDSTISIVRRERLDEELSRLPDIYRYFIHSITRKFRIVMCQMADMLFHSSIGKIADILIRLSSQEARKIEGKIIINMPLTHQDLANLIGCSRVTVTRGLNQLKNEGIIDIEKKMIIINNMDKLKKYTDLIDY